MQSAVCVDPAGSVVAVASRSARPVPISSSIPQLAESLLVYQALVAPLLRHEEGLMDGLHSALAEGGGIGRTSAAFSPDEAARAREAEASALRFELDAAARRLREIDPAAMAAANGLWVATLDDLARANGLDWTARAAPTS